MSTHLPKYQKSAIVNRKLIDGFQSLQRIGNDAAANDNLTGCAHKIFGSEKAQKNFFCGILQQTNVNRPLDALKILVLRCDGQIVFPRHAKLIGVIKIKTVPRVDFGKPGIAGFTQRKNGELRQRVRREPGEKFRSLLPEQQHANGMKCEVGNPSHSLIALQKRFAFLPASLAKQDFQKNVGIHQIVHRNSLR